MNIIQLQDKLKSIPNEILVGYVQTPTGEVPTYLALGELQRRKTMREKYNDAKAPETSVSEQIVEEASPQTPQIPPQGIAQGMPPQGMPPQGMPPQMPQGMPQGMPQEAGVAGLSAPNVGQNYNTGGIVAFEEGDLIRPDQNPLGEYNQFGAIKKLLPMYDEYGQFKDGRYTDKDGSPNYSQVAMDTVNVGSNALMLGSGVGIVGWGAKTLGQAAIKKMIGKYGLPSAKKMLEKLYKTNTGKGYTSKSGKQYAAGSPQGNTLAAAGKKPGSMPLKKSVFSPLRTAATAVVGGGILEGLTSDSPEAASLAPPVDPNNSAIDINGNGDGSGGITTLTDSGPVLSAEEQMDLFYQNLQDNRAAEQAAFGIAPRDEYYQSERDALQQERDKTSGDKDAALNMSLIEAGLGIAGGTSQNALENIAKGAVPGIASYARAKKERKAEDKLFDKESRLIDRSERAEGRSELSDYRANELERAKIAAASGLSSKDLTDIATKTTTQMDARYADKTGAGMNEIYQEEAKRLGLKMVGGQYSATQLNKARNSIYNREWSELYELNKTQMPPKTNSSGTANYLSGWKSKLISK